MNSTTPSAMHAGCGHSCDEYRRLQSAAPTRRSVLGVFGAALATAAVPGWIPRVTYADSENSSRDVLVTLFLRGGADGLTLVAPYGDPHFDGLRPTLAVRPPDASARAALDLDGFFGFPKAMAPLLESFQAGHLAIVHAVGSTQGTRSHFDAMHFMEVGRPDPTLATGWIGRHLQSAMPRVAEAPLRAMGIGYGLQKSLIGAPLALPVPEPEAFGFLGAPDSAIARDRALRALHERTREPLQTAAANTFRTVDLLAQLDFEGHTGDPAVPYPDDELGRALRATAALIRAEVGVEAVAVDQGGWDTHDEQGPFDGVMSGNMNSLSRSLAAFHADLFARPECRVTLVVASEFGRNAAENASLGTDHGYGNAMFVLSPTAAGGRVHCDWPGLAPEQLWEGQDLDIRWDYRDVLCEVLSKRLGVADAAAVFGDPDFTPTDRNVLAAG